MRLVLKLLSRRSWLRSAARPAVSGLLVLLIVFFSLSAADLGHEQHHESDPGQSGQTEQTCAVCLFKHGQFDSASPVPVVAGPTFTLRDSGPTITSVLLPAVDYRLLPGRAPPSLCS
jgi:hypothetical protein